MRRVHVVAGVVSDSLGRFLLARRPEHAHQGGLWEFPGGKREAGESPFEALQRELHEELDIHVTQARPLIRVPHDYPDKAVLLDVWRVERWHGTPWGREGQPVDWCRPEELAARAFPAANLPIVGALRLPPLYLITPEPTEADFFARLEACLDAGARLVQLRAKSLDAPAYARCAERALALCARYHAELLLNAEPALARSLGAHGAHLSGARLAALAERPLDARYRLAASCHTDADLARARKLGVDFVVLSPVRRTASHPEAAPLGWRRFFELGEQAACPVYALGGLRPAHLPLAWAHGAQGIAAIRGLWEHPEALRGWTKC